MDAVEKKTCKFVEDIRKTKGTIEHKHYYLKFNQKISEVYI